MEERFIEKLCYYLSLKALGKTYVHRCSIYTQQPNVTDRSLKLHLDVTFTSGHTNYSRITSRGALLLKASINFIQVSIKRTGKEF